MSGHIHALKRQQHAYRIIRDGYYLCVGSTVAGVFSDAQSALNATVKNFAPGINVQIKKTCHTDDCVAGQRGISQKSRGIYRRRLKPGDFTL